MKKLQSTLPNMAIVLTLISVLAGGILAYVNSVTEGPIAQIKEKNLADGIKTVLNAQDLTVQDSKTLDAGDVLYITDKGTAVKTVTNGFGGALTVLVGFDNEGNIQGYQVLEHAETPGLGAKAGDWFQKDAKGDIIGMNPGKKELVVSKDGGDVDAITASTITSRAFLLAVNNAYKSFKNAAVTAPAIDDKAVTAEPASDEITKE
ncbi:MAG: RnfABCDGE type electron transport complex subunit G [Bacteroidaceae bacterium]|jgi:electron transport complex protein RnfG|nr:RnfABCDGE type electron transport complex subunit G [Bacteroidaceae bacterium]